MSVEIPAREHGRVHVFALDLPAPEIPAFLARDTATEDPVASWPLRAALGADHLEPDEVELVRLADLDGVGLDGYLAEGLGVAEAEVERDRETLEGLTGHVILLRSRAFGGVGQTLVPRPPLRHLGSYREVQPAPPESQLSASSAEPGPGPDAPAPKRGAGPEGTGGPGRGPVILAALLAAALIVLLIALLGR